MQKQGNVKKVPIIEGWFTMDTGEPNLIGNRCKSCGEYFFPKAFFCRNPNCRKKDLEEVLLSRKGNLWSFTVNHYPASAPYVPPSPFVPYAIAVVELPKEKLMVMGQVAHGYELDKLKIGMEMELIVEKLYDDQEGNEHIIWKWKPL